MCLVVEAGWSSRPQQMGLSMKLGLPHGMAAGSHEQDKRHRERESVTFCDLDLKVMQGHFHPYCVHKKMCH